MLRLRMKITTKMKTVRNRMNEVREHVVDFHLPVSGKSVGWIYERPKSIHVAVEFLGHNIVVN